MANTRMAKLAWSVQAIMAASWLFLGSIQRVSAREITYTCQIIHEDGSKGKLDKYRLNTVINKGEVVSSSGETNGIDDVTWGSQSVTVNIVPAGTGGRMLQSLVIPINGGISKYTEIIDVGQRSPLRATMRASCIRSPK